MRFEQRRPENHEASVLPLINIVFLLLIFFMLAGSLSVSEPLRVTAPESISETDPEASTLKILLGADGQLALGNDILKEHELLDKLTTSLKEDPSTRVQLKADAAVAANQVAQLLEALREQGIDSVRLVTLNKYQ